jgi:hypothetical protein
MTLRNSVVNATKASQPDAALKTAHLVSSGHDASRYSGTSANRAENALAPGNN